jgi:hypothetical protein
MILLRYLLICIIGYLVVRVFLKLGEDSKSSSVNNPEKNGGTPPKKISKKIGEYVDYEEIKREKEKQR